MYDVVTLTAQKFKLVFDEIDGESIWYDFMNILSNACVDEGFILINFLKLRRIQIWNQESTGMNSLMVLLLL